MKTGKLCSDMLLNQLKAAIPRNCHGLLSAGVCCLQDNSAQPHTA